MKVDGVHGAWRILGTVGAGLDARRARLRRAAADALEQWGEYAGLRRDRFRGRSVA